MDNNGHKAEKSGLNAPPILNRLCPCLHSTSTLHSILTVRVRLKSQLVKTMLTIKYFRVWVFGNSCNVGAYGAANHRAAHWALLETAVAALADGEVAARDEHYRARGRHTHDAHALLRGTCLLCVRGRDYYGLAASRTTAGGGHEIVRGVPPELCSARHKVRVAIDVLFALPFLVCPDTFKQLLCACKIVS